VTPSGSKGSTGRVGSARGSTDAEQLLVGVGGEEPRRGRRLRLRSEIDWNDDLLPARVEPGVQPTRVALSAHERMFSK